MNEISIARFYWMITDKSNGKYDLDHMFLFDYYKKPTMNWQVQLTTEERELAKIQRKSTLSKVPGELPQPQLHVPL